VADDDESSIYHRELRVDSGYIHYPADHLGHTGKRRTEFDYDARQCGVPADVNYTCAVPASLSGTTARSIQSRVLLQHFGQYDADDHYDGEHTSTTSTAKPMEAVSAVGDRDGSRRPHGHLFAERQKIAPLRDAWPT